MNTTLIGVSTLSWLLICAPAGAQQPRRAGDDRSNGGYATPPVLTQPVLTLSEAAALSIRHSPVLGRLREEVRFATGLQQAATGTFDALFTAGADVGLQQQQLPPSLRRTELGKRQLIAGVADGFAALLDQLRNSDSHSTQPRCPDGLRTGTVLAPSYTFLDRRDPTEVALLGVHSDVRPQAAADLVHSNPVIVVIDGITKYDFSEICSLDFTRAAPEGLLRDAWGAINQSAGLGLQGTLTSIDQLQQELPAALTQIAQTVATRAELALERLGAAPTEGQQRTASLSTAVHKRLRNGIAVDGRFQVQSQEQLYTGKPLDPAFGGFDVPALFQSSASIRAEVPLGKGRGRASVEAPVVAAGLVLAARRDQLQHAISEEVLRTTLSYLTLVTAQQRLALVEESAGRQASIVRLTQERFDAGVAARADLSRARARAALVESTVRDAKSSLLDARFGLAEATGLDADGVANAPLAADTFAAPSPTVAFSDALVGQATAARVDIRALQHRREAAAVLVSAAGADLRHVFDFSIEAGWATLYDSPFFRYLPDERGPIFSQLSTLRPPDPPAARFYSPRGYLRSLNASWQPFVLASLSIRLPFSNNSAKGRFSQAQAALSDHGVRERDLQRTVRQHVLELTSVVGRARASLAESERAVAESNDVLASTTALYEAGDQTLIDTLLTEQTLTENKLALIDRQQRFFSAVARLRFETGELVRFDGAAQAATFDSSPLVRH